MIVALPLPEVDLLLDALRPLRHAEARALGVADGTQGCELTECVGRAAEVLVAAGQAVIETVGPIRYVLATRQGEERLRARHQLRGRDDHPALQPERAAAQGGPPCLFPMLPLTPGTSAESPRP